MMDTINNQISFLKTVSIYIYIYIIVILQELGSFSFSYITSILYILHNYNRLYSKLNKEYRKYKNFNQRIIIIYIYI